MIRALVYFAVVVYRDTGDASVFERMDHPEVLSRFERHVTPPSSQSVEKISSASQQRMSSNQEKPDGPDAGRECSTASGENSLKNDRSGTENSLGSAQCQEEVLESAILSRNVSNVSDHVSDVLSTPNLLVAHRNQSTPNAQNVGSAGTLKYPRPWAPDPLDLANGDLCMQPLRANTRLCTNAGCLARSVPVLGASARDL